MSFIKSLSLIINFQYNYYTLILTLTLPWWLRLRHVACSIAQYVKQQRNPSKLEAGKTRRKPVPWQSLVPEAEALVLWSGAPSTQVSAMMLAATSWRKTFTRALGSLKMKGTQRWMLRQTWVRVRKPAANITLTTFATKALEVYASLPTIVSWRAEWSRSSTGV